MYGVNYENFIAWEQARVLCWSLAFSSKRRREYTIYGEGNVTVFLFNMHSCFITYILTYVYA